jgi:hypothetical protein
MRKIITLAAVSALMMGGCSSITTSPNNDEVIPYNDDKSLAWNVMNQIESADKLYDVKTLKNDSVKDTSALGHVGFALLSGNLFGGLAASVATDGKGNITHSNLIQSLDLSNAPNGDLKLEVTNQFIARLKARDPSVSIDRFKESWNGYSFNETSDRCTKYLIKISKDHPNEPRYQRMFDLGYCYVDLDIDIIGPSNPKVFNNSAGQVTVRLYTIGIRHLNTFVSALDDAYLYNASITYSRKNVVSMPYVEYKGRSYLFMKKTPEGKERSIPTSEMVSLNEKIRNGEFE